MTFWVEISYHALLPKRPEANRDSDLRQRSWQKGFSEGDRVWKEGCVMQ